MTQTLIFRDEAHPRSRELNVGQLMRQFHDGGAVLVGFTTYTGEVRAASERDGPGRKMKVRRRADALIC